MIKIQSFPPVKRLNSILVLLLITRIGLACSCGSYEPNFYKNITGKTYICMAVYDTTTTSYNSNINIYDYTGHFIVADTIGNSGLKTGDTIPVIGQNGLNCGEVLSQFSKGDTLFLCLQKNYFGQSLKENFYLEGACGKYFLPIKNGQYAGLTIPQIKNKINNVISQSSKSCNCFAFWNNYDFYINVSNKTLNCLAVFKGFDYSHEYNGLKTQTGHFMLLDTIGKFESLPGNSIVVLGEDGINCGAMLNQFNVGDTLFLALNHSYYESFKKDTFYLEGGMCGNFHLKLTNGKSGGLTTSEIMTKIKSIITGLEEIIPF